MIVPEKKPRWIALVLTHQGSALSRIHGRLAAVFVVALIVTVLADHFDVLHTTVSLTPFSLIGLALSIFLGFRNNTSYDRFWEGRRLWGGLVNVTRTMARRTQLFVEPAPASGATQRELVYRTIAYVHALRMHLRTGVDVEELRPYLSEADVAALRGHKNVPIAVLQQISERLRTAWKAGQIETYHLPELESALAQMTDIQGGCERIKSTPIPHSYTVLIHRIVALYCFGLPFGIVETLHGWTPVVTLIVAYAFLGLDAVGDEIEDPFGTDYNDLPLSALSRTIEVNLRQSLGETDVPDLMQPVDGILN